MLLETAGQHLVDRILDAGAANVVGLQQQQVCLVGVVAQLRPSVAVMDRLPTR